MDGNDPKAYLLRTYYDLILYTFLSLSPSTFCNCIWNCNYKFYPQFGIAVAFGIVIANFIAIPNLALHLELQLQILSLSPNLALRLHLPEERIFQ